MEQEIRLLLVGYMGLAHSGLNITYVNRVRENRDQCYSLRLTARTDMSRVVRQWKRL